MLCNGVWVFVVVYDLSECSQQNNSQGEVLKLGRLCNNNNKVTQNSFVVKEVKRAGIIDTCLDFEERTSASYDVKPASDFDKENALYQVGCSVFELEGFVFNRFLKLQPFLLFLTDKVQTT